MKYLLTTMCVLLVAALSLTADAQARKRSSGKRKANTATTTRKNNGVGRLLVYYATSYFETDGTNYSPGDYIADNIAPSNYIGSSSASNYILTNEFGMKYNISKSKANVKKYTISHLPVSSVGRCATFASNDGCLARIFKSSNNGHHYYDCSDGSILDQYKRPEGCYIFSADYYGIYYDTNQNEKYGKVLFEEEIETEGENFKLYFKDWDNVRTIGGINLQWRIASEKWPENQSAYDANGNLLTDLCDEPIENNRSIAFIADLDAIYFNGKLYYRQKDVQAPKAVGTLTAYYAKATINTNNYGSFLPGQLITDSNNSNYQIKNYNNAKYKLEIEFNDAPETLLVPKSNIEVKQYTMNKLPVDAIGQKTVFKTEDGLIVKIFKSHNNGHRYCDTDGGSAPASWTSGHEGCYVISGEIPQWWTSDGKQLFEDQLSVSGGFLNIYTTGDNGKIIGWLSEQWTNTDSWGNERSAFDDNGNLLCDQWSTEGYVADYHSIAYLADEDAIYINGKLYYRQKDNLQNQTVEKVPQTSHEDIIYESVQQMPQYPGGETALMKYIASHIQYPTMAQENNVQGNVVLKFVVKKDGSIGEIKVARSVDKDLDKEAVRLIQSICQKFIPGRQNGEPVSVWYTMPIRFKLQGTN